MLPPHPLPGYSPGIIPRPPASASHLRGRRKCARQLLPLSRAPAAAVRWLEDQASGSPPNHHLAGGGLRGLSAACAGSSCGLSPHGLGYLLSQPGCVMTEGQSGPLFNSSRRGVWALSQVGDRTFGGSDKNQCMNLVTRYRVPLWQKGSQLAAAATRVGSTANPGPKTASTQTAGVLLQNLVAAPTGLCSSQLWRASVFSENRNRNAYSWVPGGGHGNVWAQHL